MLAPGPAAQVAVIELTGTQTGARLGLEPIRVAQQEPVIIATSNPDRPHPLFQGLLAGAMRRKAGREPRLLDLDAVH